MKPAYYNEIDPFAAAWLRELIKAGHIAPGDVDTRSIEDVRPDDLRPYTQHHFFAGIGVWSYALRRAGWSDDRRVWSASCPCQPFSAAGKGAGFNDERHLWPHLHYLASVLRPGIILGEQVASHDAGPWLDLVQTDMEGLGYAFGAVAFPSAGVGAPHIRDRAYWVADAQLQQRSNGQRAIGVVDETRGRQQGATKAARLRSSGGLANAAGQGLQRSVPAGQRTGAQFASIERNGTSGGMANTNGERPSGDAGEKPRVHQGPRITGGSGVSANGSAGPTNGLWRDADWLLCRDGKWRSVEPGTFPLVNGAPARVGRLRGYGNAINAEQARIFIEAVSETVN